MFIDEYIFPEYCALFWSERYWSENFGRNAARADRLRQPGSGSASTTSARRPSGTLRTTRGASPTPVRTSPATGTTTPTPRCPPTRTASTRAGRSGDRAAADPRRPGHPHDEFFAPWREARAQRYGSAERPPRSRLPWRRAKKRRAVVTIVHNEADLPADLAALLLALLRRRRHLRARQRHHRRLHAGAGLRPHPGRPATGSTMCGWPRRWPEFQHRLLERYDVVLVTDFDEIVAPDPSGARSAPTSIDSTRSSSTRSATRSSTCPTASRRSTRAARCSTSAATGSPTTPTTSRCWRPCR